MTSGLRRANVATGELAMREVYCVVVLIAKAVSEGTTKNAHTQVKRVIILQKIDYIYLIRYSALA